MLMSMLARVLLKFSVLFQITYKAIFVRIQKIFKSYGKIPLSLRWFSNNCNWSLNAISVHGHVVECMTLWILRSKSVASSYFTYLKGYLMHDYTFMCRSFDVILYAFLLSFVTDYTLLIIYDITHILLIIRNVKICVFVCMKLERLNLNRFNLVDR